MRLHILTIVLFVLFHNALTFQDSLRIGKSLLDNRIKKVANCIAKELKEGVESCGIPPFNPLKLDETLVDTSTIGIEGLGGTLEVNNFTLDSATDFTFEHLRSKFHMMSLTYELQATLLWNRLTLHTNYLLKDFHYDDFSLFGNGSLSFSAINSRAKVDIEVSTDSKIKSCSIIPAVEGVEYFTVTGLRNDEVYSENISHQVQEDAFGMLNRISGFLNKSLCAVIIQTADGQNEYFSAAACLAKKCPLL